MEDNKDKEMKLSLSHNADFKCIKYFIGLDANPGDIVNVKEKEVNGKIQYIINESCLVEKETLDEFFQIDLPWIEHDSFAKLIHKQLKDRFYGDDERSDSEDADFVESWNILDSPFITEKNAHQIGEFLNKVDETDGYGSMFETAKALILSLKDQINPLDKFKQKSEKQSNILEDTPFFGKKKNKSSIILEDEQQVIFDNVIKNREELRVVSIEGSAGTGKSTLVGKIIDAIYQKNDTICVVAPTHQSLKVIRDMVVEATGINLDFDDGIVFKTVHGFLGLKLQIDNDGNEIYKTCDNSDEPLVRADYLFVDESSMVNAELSRMIFNAASKDTRIRKQIIFVGDRYQLKPVNGEENLIFTSANEMIYKYSLKTVRRQKADSEIIQLSQYLVRLIDDNDQFNMKHFFETLLTPRKDISIFHDSQEFMNTYFQRDTHKIVGCYANKLVTQYNDYIRWVKYNKDYPNGMPLYVKDEELIFLQPYTNNGALVFNNGDIIKVQTMEYKCTFDKSLWYFFCKTEDGTSFKILDPNYQSEHKRQIDLKADIAKASKGRARSMAWKSFFELKNKFAKVRQVHANTFHKLQGSTYDDVFINTSEFMNYIRYDLDGMLRLIYVAITRGKKLYLLR